MNLQKGAVLSVDAVDGAAYALVSLEISPGPGCFTAICEEEKVELSNKKFTSEKIKYFEVRLNDSGKQKGINEIYYDIQAYWVSTLDADSIIRFSQYDSNNALIKVTNISLGDKTPTETT